MKRRINKSGGVTVPKAIRADAGLHPGMAVDINVEAGKVTMTAVHNCCFFCGSPDDVQSVMQINICRCCARRLQEELK